MAGSREHDAAHEVEVARPPIPRRQSHKLVFVWVWWIQVLGLCERGGIRLLHCGNFTPAGYICRWAKRVLGIPYFIYFHGMDIEKAARKMARPGWRARELRGILDGAALHFANSRDTKARLMRSGVPEKKIVVLSPGVELDRFRPGAVSSPRAAAFVGLPTLLTVGRYAKRKGVDLVVRALPLIRRSIPDAQLVILGRRQEENLAPLVRELNLEEAVHFFGEVEERELPDFYRASSLFVMPAYEEEAEASVEGFGIVFLGSGGLRDSRDRRTFGRNRRCDRRWGNRLLGGWKKRGGIHDARRAGLGMRRASPIARRQSASPRTSLSSTGAHGRGSWLRRCAAP